MKAKYINNRPAQFRNFEHITIGDIIEVNNPPRGVNFWLVLNKSKVSGTLFYDVEMVEGTANKGSRYTIEYVQKTIGSRTDFFFSKQYKFSER